MHEGTKEKVAWLCESCDRRSETIGEINIRPSCPVCQMPMLRIREIMFSDLVEEEDLTEFFDLKCKNNNYSSKRKMRRHIQTGVRKGVDGRVVDVQRRIDVDADEYEERILDLKTGELIRNCKEPLSDHRGRGSARKKRENGV